MARGLIIGPGASGREYVSIKFSIFVQTKYLTKPPEPVNVCGLKYIQITLSVFSNVHNSNTIYTHTSSLT